MFIEEIINQLVEERINFTDLHVREGKPTKYRIPSGLSYFEDGRFAEKLSDNDFLNFMRMHQPMSLRLPVEMNMTLSEKEALYFNMQKNKGQLDFAAQVQVKDVIIRFRCNLYLYEGQRKFGLALRRLSSKIPSLETIGAPALFQEFAERTTGIVLVTGATGSGKSTSLAALIDHINSTRNDHIITIEDPIEYIHSDKESTITQREVGADVRDFASGLEAALREDPDDILIGEIRSKETAEAALMAAETGHLVFATLHTNSAAQTIERLLSMFEADERDRIQNVLATVLVGVSSQVLVPSRDGRNRVLVAEVMKVTGPISAAIRTGKMHQINNEILQGISEHGMSLMNKELAKLVDQGVIRKDVALRASYSPSDLEKEL